jgi:hypothetical protein
VCRPKQPYGAPIAKLVGLRAELVARTPRLEHPSTTRNHSFRQFYICAVHALQYRATVVSGQDFSIDECDADYPDKGVMTYGVLTPAAQT